MKCKIKIKFKYVHINAEVSYWRMNFDSPTASKVVAFSTFQPIQDSSFQFVVKKIFQGNVHLFEMVHCQQQISVKIVQMYLKVISIAHNMNCHRNFLRNLINNVL